MRHDRALALLPNAKKVVVILSGGMDSAIATRLATAKYGACNVHALTFSYGQRQSLEITKAGEICAILGVHHFIADLSVLGEIAQGFSANVDRSIKMPTILDVIGDPSPKTEVPFRNMIMLSIASSYAQVNGCTHIICGLQVHDAYQYWDTTQSFLDKMNAVLNENRKDKITIIAPFASLNKLEEINILEDLDGNIDLLSHTLTCYDPNEIGESCGRCPSCSERIGGFAKAGHIDSIPYSVDIPWERLIDANA